jgi:transposase
MNQHRKFTEEFKQEAARQVIERGYPIKEVAERLGISDKTPYNRVNRYKMPDDERNNQDTLTAENRAQRLLCLAQAPEISKYSPQPTADSCH